MASHNAILRDVDQTAGEVSGVGGLQSRVRETFPRAVRGIEVFQHVQAFLEVRNDRGLDDLAGRLGHQAAHSGQLLHLGRRAARSRMRHHVDRIRLHLGIGVVALGR